jgi:hypothetical protein
LSAAALAANDSRRWEDAGVVGGFASAAPNPVLLEYARAELGRPQACTSPTWAAAPHLPPAGPELKASLPTVRRIHK